MSQPDFLLSNNATYVAKGEVPSVNFMEGPLFVPKGETLKAGGRTRYAVVTCMDPRIDPIRALGLNPAAIIRNAGGVSADALPSLIAWQELTHGKEIAVVHHTDCGMLRLKTEEIHAGPKNIPVGMHFHEFSDLDEGVRRDVLWLKERVQDGALLEGTHVVGYIIENETGKLRVVE